MEKSKSTNYSDIAIEWLNYVTIMSDVTINISHACNGGEVVITDPELVTVKTKKPKKYIVDGFCEETNTIYEYYGTMCHGDIKQNNSEFFHRKHAATIDRENRLRELGFTVIVMWHADWLEIRKNI
jgi:hypothetical protein